jgi:hypothetical protein
MQVQFYPDWYFRTEDNPNDLIDIVLFLICAVGEHQT